MRAAGLVGQLGWAILAVDPSCDWDGKFILRKSKRFENHWVASFGGMGTEVRLSNKQHGDCFPESG